MKKTLIAAILLGTLNISNAQDWSGQGEAGFVSSSGNTESEKYNLGIALKKEGTEWINDIGVRYFKSSDDGIDSADSLSADYTLKRVLSERRYIFGSLGYLDDEFDGFTEQSSVSVGFGYHVYLPDPIAWEVGIGIGYRDTSELTILDDGSEIEGDDLSGETLVLRSNYTHQLTDSTQFIDTFKAEIGSDNTFIENDAALSVAISDAFALKASYLVRHNTDPAEGSDETDTLTSISLVYQFAK